MRPDHTTPDKVIEAVFARRHGWATATDISAPAMALDDAKAHLARVAASPNRSLPCAAGLDAASLVARRDLAAQRARADDIDHHVADEIDDWLAGLHEIDKETADLEDQQMLEAEARLLEHIDRAHPAGLPPTGEPQEPAEAGRRPTLGAIRKARGLLDNDFRYIEPQALQQIRQSNQEAAEAGPPDNPWLIELWALYQRADADGRGQLAPVIAAVCDPPARRRIEALAGCEPVDAQSAAWAADVRAAVAARRKARHRSVLDDLADRRAARVAQVCAADMAHLLEADAQRWETAIEDWADSGCATRHLATAWEQAAIDIASDLFDADSEHRSPPGPTLPLPDSRPPRHQTGLQEPPPAMSVPEIASLAHRPGTRPAQPPAPDHARAEHDAAAVQAAAHWYHRLLVESPEAAEARDYLIARGITEDQWDKWQIGWAPDQWQGLAAHLHRCGIGTRAGIDAGMLGETNGRAWDFLRGRVVFPIRDAEGTPIALAGRTLREGPKYLNTRNTRLYDKSEALYGIEFAAEAIAQTGEAVIVEGYTDAIAAHTAGIQNAVAACGTGFGPGHIDTLDTECGAPGLLTLALDSDSAGTKAARSIAQLANQHSRHTRTVQLPAGADPADLEPQQLRRSIRQAPPHPWSAIAEIIELDRDKSFSQLAKAARAAVQNNAADPIAAVLAAHEIAIAADFDLQQLIDSSLPAPTEIASPARTAGIGL
ncbi:MAG: toprim domain-containing protein [bacterium]|nr:toprim domain-containing protein [bacterium]